MIALKKLTIIFLFLFLSLFIYIVSDFSNINSRNNLPIDNLATSSSSSIAFSKEDEVPLPTPTKHIISPSIQSKQLPKPTNPQNYQLTPCDNGLEGCFSIVSAPQETMSTVSELNDAINNYRKSHNLNLLNIDSQICNLASQRAYEIKGSFTHDGFRTHVENGDYDFLGFFSIGENLWQGSFSGVHIVEYGWDQSPGHRANLQGDWSRGCAGIYATNAVYMFVK